MPSKPELQALRRQIAKQERFAPNRWPVISLGTAALDDVLPDGGITTGALHEILPSAHGDFAAALGFSFGLITQITRDRPGFVLWALPSYQTFRQGMIYPIGLPAIGFDPNRLVHLHVPKPQDVLWALEESLSHSTPATVIGILPENDRSYDFTASRRLAMRAAENGITVFLIRNLPAPEIATAAETRWLVAAEPSVAQHRIGQSIPGLGPPRWKVQLTKSKRGKPGCWQVEWDYETFSFRLVAPVANRAPIRAYDVYRQKEQKRIAASVR